MSEEPLAELARLDPFSSPTRTKELVEQLPVVVYVDSDDRRPRTLYITPNIERLLGYPRDRFIEDRGLWVELIHPDDRERVLELWDLAWERGSRVPLEYRMTHRDGREIWVRNSCMLVLSDEGQRLAWQGVVEDLTGEKQSKHDAKTSEARYEALVESVPVVVYEMDRDDERRTLYVSPHVEHVLGYSREEWLDQPDIWVELLHADDREHVLAAHDLHNDTGRPWDLEYRLIANDGRVVWVHDRASLISGTIDQPTAWHGVMIDVTAEHEANEMLLLHKEELERRVTERTNELSEANELMSLEIGERRRMEKELREAQGRYRSLIEDVPGIVYTWEVAAHGSERDFSYVGPQVERLLGFTADEWDASARLHPHDRAEVMAALERCATTGDPLAVEYRYLAKDGHVVWILDRASLIARTPGGAPATFQGVMLDVTALKEAQSKAEQAEDRFRALTEAGPVVAYAYELIRQPGIWPPQIELTYMSPQMADIVGYAPERLMADPKRWRALLHPDDRDAAVAEFERSWRTGIGWNVRYRIIRRDGEVVWVRSFGRMLARDDEGQPWRFQGVLFDITAEQEELTRLRATEEAQRTALDGVRAIPWSEEVHPDSGLERYRFIGPQSLEILGYPPEDLIAESRHFPRMIHDDDRPMIHRSMHEAARTGVWNATYRVSARDGSLRSLHSFGRRVSPDGEIPEIWHGVTVDVTPVAGHDAGIAVSARETLDDPTGAS
jgi:PAS domain S-box-containing protein